MRARASQKHEREAVRAISREYPDATVSLEAGARTHKKLVVTRSGTTVTASVSCSPGIPPEHMVNQIRQNIRRAFAQKGIEA